MFSLDLGARRDIGGIHERGGFGCTLLFCLLKLPRLSLQSVALAASRVTRRCNRHTLFLPRHRGRIGCIHFGTIGAKKGRFRDNRRAAAIREVIHLYRYQNLYPVFCGAMRGSESQALAYGEIALFAVIVIGGYNFSTVSAVMGFHGWLFVTLIATGTLLTLNLSKLWSKP